MFTNPSAQPAAAASPAAMHSFCPLEYPDPRGGVGSRERGRAVRGRGGAINQCRVTADTRNNVLVKLTTELEWRLKMAAPIRHKQGTYISAFHEPRISVYLHRTQAEQSL